MKRFLIVIFILFKYTFNIYSQNNTCFKILIKNEKTNEIIKNINVFIDEINKFYYINNEGYLNFCSDKNLLHLNIEGYKNFELKHTDTSKIFFVKSKYKLEEEVIITNINGDLQSNSNISSFTVLKPTTLFNNTAYSAFDVIAKQNGVSLITQGPAINKISIRGLSNNRIGIIQDGIRLENQQWGDDHGIELNDLNLEKIEIIKMPISLIYGSDALGGLVNFISKKNIIKNTIQGDFSNIYNSNNKYFSTNLNLMANINDIVFGAWGNLKRSQDYTNKYDAYVLNSKFQEENFGFSSSIEKKWGNINLTYNSYDKILGLFDGKRDSLTGKFLYKVGDITKVATDDLSKTYSIDIFPMAKIQQKNLLLNTKFYINSKNHISIVLGFQQNIRNELEDVNISALNLNLKTFNYSLIYSLQNIYNFKTNFGIVGLIQNNSIAGKEYLIPEYNSNEIGAVFITSRNINNNLLISFGFRSDLKNLQTTNLIIEKDGVKKEMFSTLNLNYFNLSYSFGLVKHFNENLVFKFGLNKGYRSPHVVELLSNGAHEGTNRFEIGNKNIVPEQNFQVDLSLMYENNYLLLKGEFFYNYILNFIFSRKMQNINGGDSLIKIDNNNLNVFKYNQNNVFLTGIEIESNLHFPKINWLNWNNKFSYLIGKFIEAIDGSYNMPKISSPLWISEIKFDFKLKNHIIKNLFYNIESIYNFSQNNYFSGYNTETFTPEYWLLNSGIGINLFYKEKNWLNFFIGVNNIFDIAYQSNLSSLKYKETNLVTNRIGIFNMGRNFVIKLIIPINYKL